MGAAIFCISAFLLGSVPFGLLVARAFNVKDLRSRGSGNIGATNVSRIVGFWPAGAITLLLDVIKGFAPVMSLQLPAVRGFLVSLGGPLGETTVWAAAFLAVAGHCFSPWLRFKGGKGVATGLGAIAALSPVAALGGVVGYALSFAYTKIGSLSSLVGVTFVAITYLIFSPLGVHSWFGAAIVALIVYRHESNINSLLENRERVFE